MSVCVVKIKPLFNPSRSQKCWKILLNWPTLFVPSISLSVKIICLLCIFSTVPLYCHQQWTWHHHNWSLCLCPSVSGLVWRSEEFLADKLDNSEIGVQISFHNDRQQWPPFLSSHSVHIVGERIYKWNETSFVHEFKIWDSIMVTKYLTLTISRHTNDVKLLRSIQWA